MSVRKKLMERARLLAARLEREADKLQEIAPEKIREAKAAHLVQQRLLQFSPNFGPDWSCPDCFILRDTVSPLKASDHGFVETGADNLDVFRCSSCGFEISVPA